MSLANAYPFDHPATRTKPTPTHSASLAAFNSNRERAIRLPEVKRITGLGTTTIYELMGQGKFPKNFSTSAKAKAWLESEVQDWLSRRAATRNAA